MADLVPGSVAAPDKSPIQKWINRLTGIHKNAPQHLQQGAHAVRQFSEAALTGGILGIVDAKRPELSDKAQLGTAAVGLVGSVLGATQDYAVDLRNIGSDAFAIYSFRKGKEMMIKKLAAHGDFEGDRIPDENRHGEIGQEDPIVAAARNL